MKQWLGATLQPGRSKPALLGAMLFLTVWSCTAPEAEDAQKSPTLSRKAAEAVITKANSFPRAEQRPIPGPYRRDQDGNWWSPETAGSPLPDKHEPPEIALLIKTTLVTTSETRDGDRGQWARVSLKLTDEGKQYSIGDGSQVKICDLVFGEITGIIVNDLTKTASVGYSLRRTGWTPFGDYFKRTFPASYPDVVDTKAELQQYDDGWRIKK